MPTAMDVASSALSPERSGVGSALLQAVRMVGGSFGAAILGSVHQRRPIAAGST